MEPVLTSGQHVGDIPRPAKNYLNENTSLWDWMTTVDHKRIGLMYLVGSLTFFMIGGLLALVLRLVLLTPQHTLFGITVSADGYNQLFTLHGAIMVFLFIIPSIPGSLTNFVLPLMLGAKDVAFPRLNLASFYIYVAGALLAIGAILIGGIDTGWTFYTPYSSSSSEGPVAIMTMAVFVLGFSSILTGLNFIATVHKLRAPGMGWFDMPLFVWGMYSTAVIQILATPVLAITVVLLAIEKTLHIGIFDPKYGGDPVLFQHFFWFYSHPAVYIM
ncbi:MAG: cbb3-type cytochrome c oxidase subunit I, partial [Acidobacteriota bacterium]